MSDTPHLVFLFPGQGAQHAGMGRGLYAGEPVYRAALDDCAARLRPVLGRDIRDLLSGADEAAMAETCVAQPTMFAVEYALSRLWASWGVEPYVMLGHSLGEYVAATVAGVFSLVDALGLVATRGRLMQALPRGAMLSVPVSEHDIKALLDEELCVAAVNAPSRSVVSGPIEAVERLQHRLVQSGLDGRLLDTSHAFHSGAMDPMLDEFRDAVRRVERHAPSVPWMSNVTGTRITAAEAIDPEYWAAHIRQPVRFLDAARELLADPAAVFLEVGPGRTLISLVRQQPQCSPDRVLVPSLRHPEQSVADERCVREALGRLWASGAAVSWRGVHRDEPRARVPLPTYPFDRQRYWIDPPAAGAVRLKLDTTYENENAVQLKPDTTYENENTVRLKPDTTYENENAVRLKPDATDESEVSAASVRAAAAPRADVSDWFFVPTWRPSLLPAAGAAAHSSSKQMLILDGEVGLGARLAERLTAAGHAVTCVRTNGASSADAYRTLIAAGAPAHVVHLGNVTRDDTPGTAESSFFSLVHLAQALSGTASELTMSIVSSGACAVAGDDELQPDKALLAGPLRVIPLEFPHITCRHVDVAVDDPAVIEHLAAELTGAAGDRVVAYRGGQRWVQAVEPRPLPAPPAGATGLLERGVYLITGGLGSMGLAFAKELARAAHARLVLIGRTPPTPAQTAALAEVEALGAEVLFVQADVADDSDMRSVVSAARARFGAIHGVIHTAGVLGQGLIWDRERRAIEATFQPKVAGMRALTAALADEPLDILVLCSSLAAVAPVPGQVDYCAANAFLDLFAADFARRTGTRTVSIGWGMWQALGLMEHPGLKAAHKQSVRDEIDREGWHDAGVEVLRRILAHPTPPHVLVSPRPLRLSAPPGYPLFAERREETPGRVEYLMRLQPGRYWVLDEHRLDGRSILPGTAYLELARAACADATGAARVELRDVFFLSPLVFEGDETKDVRLMLVGDAFHVVSRVTDDTWVEHARGTVRPLKDGLPERPANVPSLERATLAADAIPFGPRWQNLREIAFGQAEGVAALGLADAFAADLATSPLHPALLDMATGFITVRHPLPGSLPFTYRRVAVWRPLTARLHSHVRVVSQTTTSLEVDATLTDEQGTVLVEIEGYRLRSAAALGPAASLDNVHLTIGSQGSLESLTLVRSSRRAPAAGEVEIQVEAAGLNFIEVLYALGMLPAAPALEDSFGLECAGRIVRTGPGSAFAVGDQVMAYANGCFAGYVTAPEAVVARRPAGLDAAEAATLPAAFATAHYALVTQGRLAKGERVLIHAAAGGVGTAAVRIAQRIGAEIFATAGSPEKRAVLAAAGVAHVLDSRSLAFADEVLARTGGRGVDVVLNSLGGEFMTRSLELVAPYGRFLELGKRDLFNGGRLDLKPFTKIISFIVIDVGPDMPGFPELWRAVTERMQAGDYRPLPHTGFAMVNARKAFDFMARARHIGKIVLTIDDPVALWDASQASRPAPRGVSLDAILGVAAPAAALVAASAARPAGPAAGHARPALATEYASPADAVEQTIVDIWGDLLGVARVGVHDSFFDLHGDSLLAAQVMGRVHAALQVKLPLSALFDEPTVAGLARRVRASAAEQEEGEI